MALEIVDHGGVKVAEVKGDISIQSAEEFKKEIMKVKNTHLILNLGAVEYIDSMGLAALIELTKLRKSHGLVIHIANASAKIKGLFDLVSGKNILSIFPDVRTAVTALKPRND